MLRDLLVRDDRGSGVLERLAAGPSWTGYFALETTMAKVSLSGMDIQSLIDLRERIDQRLLECRADIEKQLARLDRSIGDETIGHSLGVPRPQFPRLCPTCLPHHPLQTILR